jgi:hypothetical protein
VGAPLSVLQMAVLQTAGAGPRFSCVELRGDAEECVDELASRGGIAPGDPADLAYPNRMHRFLASIARHAPSAERKPRLAAIRFLINLWSCSITLFDPWGARHPIMPGARNSFAATKSRLGDNVN